MSCDLQEKMITVLIFFCMLGTIFSEENVLCTDSVCKDIACPTFSVKCQTQNSTHNGLVLPGITTCGCCSVCLDNLHEGEECSAGDISDPLPKEICGPGLYCKTQKDEDVDGICSRMNTTCTQRQDDYDQRKTNGTLGMMEIRQDCDDEGDFATYKCIPGQTCYCVNATGSRIFGESDFTSLPDVELKCKCSRDYENAENVIGKTLSPVEHFRCSPDGNYDTIQCMNDKCFCVDAYDGAPTYPNEPSVNITDISKSTLKCYKNTDPGVYYKKCEQKYVEKLEEYRAFEEYNFNMILGSDFPKCDLDGSYAPVQANKTHKYCVDKEGTVLTAVNIENNLADSMNCKCIRALLIMTTNEKPTCLENGNYSPIQCRRGRCRCVDNDGNQVCNKDNCEGNENDLDSLCSHIL